METRNPITPKVSVIVPVYKVEQYLPACIESVLAQTMEDFEMILVDDGSPDSSGKICDDYAAKDSRIRVFHKENGGVVSARMHGLKEARGEYVIFLDGDDMWTKTALTGLWDSSIAGAIDFIRGGFFYENENGGIYNVVTPSLKGVFDVDDLLSRSFNTIFDYTAMCVWGNLYRKEVALAAAQDVGSVKINHSEDGLFAVAVFLHSHKISFLKDPFYYYLQRDGSALHRFNHRVVEAQKGFLNAMENILRKSNRVPAKKIEKIMQEHTYVACAYIGYMLLAAPTYSDMQKMLYALRSCPFFQNAKRSITAKKLKRKILIMILDSTLAFSFFYFLKRTQKFCGL